MAQSRSALDFMQRSGLIAESRQPAPRLEPGAMLINFVPEENRNLDTKLLQGFEGEPPPDRAVTKPWPSVRDEA